MKTIFLSSNLLRVAPSQVEEKLLVLNSFLDATHINILLLSGLSKDSLNERIVISHHPKALHIASLFIESHETWVLVEIDE